jgi:sodium-dependent dicarboxylate transporter 2/3/5
MDKVMNISVKKKAWLLISLLMAFLVFFLRPMGMDKNQSLVSAILILTIIWWSTNLVNKIVPSCLLLTSFIFLTPTPLKIIFTFPLSESFLLIALTYIFSKGIENSNIAAKFLEPFLLRFANTPIKVMISGVLMLVITMYIIPQPLARLIIVSGILNHYLNETDSPQKTKRVLLLSLFVFYIFVNMFSLKADIIMNQVSIDVAGLSLSDLDWIRYMAVPSFIYLIIAILVICILFHNDIQGILFKVNNGLDHPSSQMKISKKDKQFIALLIVTVTFWMTESFHGIPAWIITLVSISIMFILKTLHFKDLKSLDISMLIFLTAALSIGGVIKANGIASILFGKLGNLLPKESIVLTIIVMMIISICMHMVLGSSTTSLSVVIPGIMFLGSSVLPAEIIMFVIYVTIAAQWLLPFHSVGMMVGTSDNYFTSGDMLKVGIAMTIIVFLAILGLFLPWWHILGAI